MPAGFRILPKILRGASIFVSIGAILAGCDADFLEVGTLKGAASAGAPGSDSAGTGGESPGSEGASSGLGGRVGEGGAPTCDLPGPAQHFDFAGSGTDVIDLRGGPSAQILGGGALDASGSLVLDGVDDYVALAERPWTGDSFSIALWVEYRGAGAYERLFDFGAGNGTIGTSYLALTPGTGYFPTGLAALLSDSGAAGEVAAVSDAILTKAPELVVVTVDAHNLELYRGSELLTRVPHDVDVAALPVEESWLGRSHYAQDRYLDATLLDLRAYYVALNACQIRALFEAGVP